MVTRRNILIGGGCALAGVGATYAGVRQMGSMEDYSAAVAASRAMLSKHPEMRDLIRYATLAPNGHNTQPWRFRVGENRIEILPDFTRRTPVVDPDDHHIFVSLGCAVENLALAASARGRPGERSFSAADDGSIVFAFGGGKSAEAALFDAIPRRQSTRAAYDRRPVPAADLRTLAVAAETPGVDLVLITDRAQIDRGATWSLPATVCRWPTPPSCVSSGPGYVSVRARRLQPQTGCSVPPPEVPRFLRGSGRACSTWFSGPLRRTTSMRVCSSRPPASRCSCQSETTRIIGRAQAVPVSASRCRRRRSA